MSVRTVVMVDDHQLLVHTVSHALAEAGVRCVGIAPRPVDALLDEITGRQPHLVLLDLDLGPFGDATGLIGRLTAAGIPVLVLTAETERIRLALAVEQGAIGLVSKTAGFEDLVRAVRNAIDRPAATRAPQALRLLDELAAHRTKLAEQRGPFQSLTERERQALAELADGRTVQQIAARWVVSQATVRSHVQAILTKLGATSQLQAVVMAAQSGWLTPERPDRTG